MLSGLVPETAGKPGAKAKAQPSKPGKLSKFLKPSAKKKNQKAAIKSKPSAKKKAAKKQTEKTLADKALSKQKLKHSQKPESPPPLPPPAEKPEQAELLKVSQEFVSLLSCKPKIATVCWPKWSQLTKSDVQAFLDEFP